MNLAKRMERLGTETAFEVLAKARKLEQEGKKASGKRAQLEALQQRIAGLIQGLAEGLNFSKNPTSPKIWELSHL